MQQQCMLESPGYDIKTKSMKQYCGFKGRDKMEMWTVKKFIPCCNRECPKEQRDQFSKGELWLSVLNLEPC